MKRKHLLLIMMMLFSVLMLFSCCTFGSDDDDDNVENTIFTVYLNVYSPAGYSSETNLTFSDDDTSGIIYVSFNAHLYDFDGYYTGENGTGIQASDAEGNTTAEFYEYCKAHKNELINVYPNATAKACTITLINPAGESPEPISTYCDMDVDLPEDLVKTGYEFKGWSYEEYNWTGSFNLHTQATEITMYAIFQPKKTYILCDGVSASIMRNEVKYDEEYTFAYTERDGYNFMGYFSEEDGQGTQYTDNTGKSLAPWSVDVDNYATVTIYAHFEPAQKYTIYIPSKNIKTSVTVTYVNFYGEDAGYNLEKTYSKSNPIQPLTPRVIPDGYRFDGWYLDSQCKTRFTYTETVTEDITLYPKFFKKSYYYEEELGYGYLKEDETHNYTLTGRGEHTASKLCGYSGNLTITATLTCPYGETASLTVFNVQTNQSKYIQYIENGQEVSCTIKVNGGDVIRLTMSGHIDANSTQNQTLKVTYSGLGNEGKQASVEIPEYFSYEVTQGNRFTLPVSGKYGYVFKGYYTEENGLGIRLTDGKGNSLADYALGADAYLYPYFEKEEA